MQTRNGKLPIILTTTPTAYGERVQMWLRAGIIAADLSAASDVLAAACWAAEVRVIPGTRHAHLVALEVIRNIHEERVQPTRQSWPYFSHGEGNGLSDTDERDTRRVGRADLPSPRLSPEESWPEPGGRPPASIPGDRR